MQDEQKRGAKRRPLHVLEAERTSIEEQLASMPSVSYEDKMSIIALKVKLRLLQYTIYQCSWKKQKAKK